MRYEQAGAMIACPRCGAGLTPQPSSWHTCPAHECAYQMPEDACLLYGEMLRQLEHDPVAFFARVRQLRDELRALEPIWQRAP